MTDAREEHPSITAARHLRTIADLWPELLAQLSKQGQRVDHGGARPKPTAQIPIDPHVSDIKAEIESWVRFLCRTLSDELKTWRPPEDTSTPALLRHIADWHIGHFTEHPDEMLAQAIRDDCQDYAHLARKTAYPTGIRKIPLHIACLEHDTNDQGQRTPCPGQYHTLLIPDRELQDMVCDHDPTHRMSPWEWQRGLRRGALNPAGITALLGKISGADRKVAL
ncbi:MAG TPA: hypothetical protein VK054_11085 [Beutenbergiaceae bacterium]|nr:hypothetical protein [Beutenbergiaceae bacterium]